MTRQWLSLVLIALACRPAKHLALGSARLDPSQCDLAVVPPGAAPADTAVRCAEAFIARNGYTLSPPADSGQLAFESIEWAGSLRAVLAERHGTLESHAAAVCAGAVGGPGYTVIFRYRGAADTTTGRAVTMMPTHAQLRVQHQDFMLAVARRGEFGCRAVP